MNDLQIFNNADFGTIRTIEENGKVLFCGSDVAKALGYAKPANAISMHCKGATLKQGNDNLGRSQQMSFVTEGDLYRLIANSKLPSAEKFERWVFDEVLPSIRQHGAYMTQETIEKALLDPDTIIQIATALKEERGKRMLLAEKIEQDKPKVIFADAVSASNAPMLIGELAKVLRQNGVDTGEKRLFEWLRTNGYLIRRKGTDYNAPTQRSMEMGLFRVKETAITHSDGHVTINRTTKVTGKGQQYFVNKFLGEIDIA